MPTRAREEAHIETPPDRAQTQGRHGTKLFVHAPHPQARAHSQELQDLSRRTRNKVTARAHDRHSFPRKYVRGLPPYDLPLILLARLAVDRRFSGRGLLLIEFDQDDFGARTHAHRRTPGSDAARGVNRHLAKSL